MVQLKPLPSQTPSSLASFKSRLVLPFWYRLTQVVLEKRPLNGCSSRLVVTSNENKGTANGGNAFSSLSWDWGKSCGGNENNFVMRGEFGTKLFATRVKYYIINEVPAVS